MKNEIDKIYLPRRLWPVIHSFSGFLYLQWSYFQQTSLNEAMLIQLYIIQYHIHPIKRL